MTDVNAVLKYYAEGSLTIEQLKEFLTNMGFSQPVIEAYLKIANERKERLEKSKDMDNRIDAAFALFQRSAGATFTPSGSLEGRAGK